ncbi:MAG: PQQ-like beta-propeller repeat protein [Planctomycetes bacterium]|nr:PQQ-like beta-propeller repeat protein [Planctomycetota bacterium]
MSRIMFAACVALVVTAAVRADDWPQFRGNNRDGHSSETGLAKKWPDSGPEMKWSFEGLGKGYASVAIAGKHVYTTGMDDKTKMGYVFCLDLSGKEVWKKSYGPEWSGGYPGSRCTPTIDGDYLYLMSGQGKAVCLKTKDGAKVWEVDTLKQFGGSNISWGISESLLIDGNKLICTPGGKDASVVALDKKTGKTIWTSKGLSESSGYCSPIMVKHGGKDMIITLTAKSIVGIEAKDGKVLWKYSYSTAYDVHAVSPVYDNGYIFASSGYGTGSVCLKLNDKGTSVEEVWKSSQLDVHHGGVLLLDGNVYGTGHKNIKGWACIDMKTGKVKWENNGVGKGSIAYADGMLYCYGKNGKFGLVKASDKGGEPVSVFKISKGSGEHWAHPAISDGVLYVRHGDALMAFDIKGK